METIQGRYIFIVVLLRRICKKISFFEFNLIWNKFCNFYYFLLISLRTGLNLDEYFMHKFSKKGKTSSRSPSLAYQVTTTSPARFDCRVKSDHRPQIVKISSQVQWIAFLFSKIIALKRQITKGPFVKMASTRVGRVPLS